MFAVDLFKKKFDPDLYNIRFNSPATVERIGSHIIK